MSINHPPNSWFKYIKFTDDILKNVGVNPITLSNPFLYPIKPADKILKDLEYLEKESKSNHLKLTLKFYVYFLKAFYDLLKPNFNRKENILRNQKRFYKKDYDVIFVSHLTNKKRLEQDFDTYYGNVINKLSKKKIILLLLIPHCIISEKEINKFILKSRNYDISIFNKELISIKTKIKKIFEILKERKKFLKLANINTGINKKLLIMTGNYFLSPGNQLYLMSYLQLKEIFKNVRAKNLVTTFEGLAWESLFYYAAHKSEQKIKCIGFQHTLLFKYQHSITRSINAIYDPDLILCAGEISAKTLKQKIKNKNLPIKVLGSPEEDKNNFQIDKKKKKKKKNIILFLPSGDLEESKYMTIFAIRIAKKYPQFSIIIRYHPIMINKFKNELEDNISNINISLNSLEDDCKLAKWAIYSSSTAIFKAIKLECDPIRLICNLPTDLCDPLWQIKSSQIRRIKQLSDLSDLFFNNYKNDDDIYKLKLKRDLSEKVNNLRTDLNLNILKKEI